MEVRPDPCILLDPLTPQRCLSRSEHQQKIGGGGYGNGMGANGAAHNGGGAISLLNGGGAGSGGYGAAGGVPGMGAGAGGGGPGGMGPLRGGGQGQYYQQGGHMHPSLFGGGGNVVVREGNGLMLGGLFDGQGLPTATPSTSSGSTRSEV